MHWCRVGVHSGKVRPVRVVFCEAVLFCTGSLRHEPGTAAPTSVGASLMNARLSPLSVHGPREALLPGQHAAVLPK